MTRPYIHADERRRKALELLRDGITISEIREGLGYACNENATRIMEPLVYAGQAFVIRARLTAEPSRHSWSSIYFTTAQARDDYIKAKNAAIEERKKARKKATFQRMPSFVKRTEERAAARAEKEAAKQRDAAEREAQRKAMRAAEAEQRKQRQRLDREAREAAKAREKSEAKKQRLRLKVETAQAGQLVFKKGTEVARPKKQSFADLPVVNPGAVQPKVIPSNLRDRFATDAAPSVISSNDCREWAKAAA